MSTIRTFSLPCGMPLLVEPSNAVRSAALTWLIPVGSAHDAPDRQGLATMLAELIFRGAGDRDSRAQADALDRLGLSRGAEVGGVYLRLSATMLGDRLLDSLPLIVDIVRRPRFEAESIEPTRALSLQALAGLADIATRRAEYVTLDELLDDLGIDAARFFFLSRKSDSHLEFDLELAKKREAWLVKNAPAKKDSFDATVMSGIKSKAAAHGIAY